MFEKLKSTLDKSIATVSVKSEVLVESSKIKNQLQNLERERAGLLAKLGGTMYEMWCTDGFNQDTFHELCQAVKTCDDAIREQNLRFEQIKREEAQILGQTARTQDPPSTPPAGSLVCTCGSVNPAGARFCTSCGKAL